MGQKKKEVAEVSEIEVVSTVKVEEAMWYRFCGEGHCFDVRRVISDNDSRFCKDCGKDVDIYEEEAIRAPNIEEATKLFKDPDGTASLRSQSETQTGLKVSQMSVPLETVHPGYAAGGSEIIQYLGMEQLRESTSNPRKHYEEKGLNDLAESIKAKGVVQNLVVRPLMDLGTDPLPAKAVLPLKTGGEPQMYEIVAGSRRFRAAKIAELKAVPCVVRQYSDAEILEIQVIENNQREDIHPLEEGEGYAALLQVEGYTVESIAGKIGRSDKYVRERLQLAKLIPEAKKYLESGEIFYTHARIISRLKEDQQLAALQFLHGSGHYSKNDKRHPGSVSELEGWVIRNVEKNLSGAPFPMDDATLVKSAGACNICPKNTACDGQLFPEYAVKSKGVCLDPICFHVKVKAIGERRIKEKLESENASEVLLVSARQYGNTLKKLKDGSERVVVGYQNFDKVKKSDKGAQEALLMGSMDMEEKGKTIYVKLKGKQDAKPSKGETRSAPTSSGSGEKELTPAQKNEQDRQMHRNEYIDNMHNIMIANEAVLRMKKKFDKELLATICKERITSTNTEYEAWAAGMTYEEYRQIPYNKRYNKIFEYLKKKEPLEMMAITVCCEVLDYDDHNALAKMFKIDIKPISAKIEKLADEKFPDPAKALLVSFTGMKYKLKEGDYLKELECISDKIRFANKKEGSDYKELNVVNPGGNNVFFRKDAKTGLYRFSTWIDSDGTAMGFDKLAEAKFVKMVKGFKAEKLKGKSKKAKK